MVNNQIMNLQNFISSTMWELHEVNNSGCSTFCMQWICLSHADSDQIQIQKKTNLVVDLNGSIELLHRLFSLFSVKLSPIQMHYWRVHYIYGALTEFSRFFLVQKYLTNKSQLILDSGFEWVHFQMQHRLFSLLSVHCSEAVTIWKRINGTQLRSWQCAVLTKYFKLEIGMAYGICLSWT